MSAYTKQKSIARQLRHHGYTLDEILGEESITAAKSTVYTWIRDIPKKTVRTEKQKAAQKKATMAQKRKHDDRRQEAYDDAIQHAKSMLEVPYFRDFIMLYLTEGYRRTKHRVSVANSNPILIQLAHHFIAALHNGSKIIYRLQYHADQNPKQLAEEWAELLDILPEEISIQRKSNSGQLKGRKWNSTHGVMTVEVYDTLFRSRVQAWMDYLQEELSKV